MTDKNKSKGAKTAREPWSVDVDVYLVSDSDPPDFHVESYLQHSPGGDLVFHNNGHPGFEVTFALHDETNDPEGYCFVNPKHNAVWSQLGDGPDYCPTSEMWEVFTPLRLSGDKMKLVVVNKNPKPAQGKFQYALRVTNGTKTLILDPGANNQNGNY
jgi:hypothetical protein